MNNKKLVVNFAAPNDLFNIRRHNLGEAKKKKGSPLSHPLFYTMGKGKYYIFGLTLIEIQLTFIQYHKRMMFKSNNFEFISFLINESCVCVNTNPHKKIWV